MNKKYTLFALFLCALVGFSSCKDDIESPNLREPEEFVLNVPPESENILDLEKTDYVILTCLQPDYGFDAAVSYSVEVSLSGKWGKGLSEVLPTVYSNIEIRVNAQEIAASMTGLSGKAEEEFPIVSPLHVRLHAHLLKSGRGHIVSNAILFPKVRTVFALPSATLPEHVYMIGGFNSWDWTKAYDMVPVHSHEDIFWQIAYVNDEDEMKLNCNKVWDGRECGWDEVEIKDNAGAGVSDGGGNIKIENGGWYLFVVRVAADGGDIKYHLEITKPKVYEIGNAMTGGWDIDDANLFEIPGTKDGFFKSKPFDRDIAGTDEDCLRACVKLSDAEWWQTEFMVFDGKLAYRGVGDDQERVGGKKGERLYINFVSEEGDIK